MVGHRRHNNEQIAQLLRRQFSSEIMRRHLRALPLFRTERWLPDRLAGLMEVLKRSEGRGRRR
ncbi:MAG: hypothetical protein EOQ55_31710 [Mesorhizobium sp.]|nr:hypothetical protein EOA79_03475 [Mesorhizobium sp. M1A.F.Ca.IN.020.03.2.1]RUV43355.1 hypothetical protein EOD29_13945 [Mesorhizobium sp. M1A.T.Ca.IN.004.03.1.1]RUV90359.1 hypothetical protein EOA51_00060 [Mesorhizobium sp. M1A.F.Ca.IN.020.32.1.1]RUV94830.1 hypothetical protein EOA75_10635 [Mesorhizobium sp. M1A.F.Ca.IN.022.07.1.1]RUW14930.1 hypothetical protein EOA46_01875 [Mesorhizobium sp. M1A.F.Ca.IN.022.05.2.1]RUW35202.1 hypothetical protein EOA60_04910 [Mesorhizobium sp. M1A.F.Ca.IN.0